MIIFNGKKEAEEILEALKRKINQEKAMPVLDVIFVGKDPASELFMRNKIRQAERTGIKINNHRFSSDAREKEIIDKIRQLDKDQNINGIIVQLPLPAGLDSGKIIGEICPNKDVDGFGKKAKFLSPLVSAIQTALKEAVQDIKKKKILAVVNSDIFGETLKSFFAKNKISIDYFIRKKTSVEQLKAGLKKADIIITAAGSPKFLKGDMIKKRAILIDAGITVSGSGKVVGDLDRESVEEKASFLTPVPGGIGPLTVAFLLKNTYLASKN